MPEAVPPAQAAGARSILTRLRTSHGFQGGVILAFATLVLNGSAYLYNVACIRYLGPRAYGDIAAMLALTAVVALPLGSVQVILAREVAQLPSRAMSARLLRRVTRSGALVGGALVLLGLVLVVPIQELLNVDSRAAVVAGVSSLFFWIVAAVLYGILQGALRFKELSATYAIGGISRVALVVPALLLGFGVVGALTVNTLAGALAVILAFYALRDLWRLQERAEDPTFDRREIAVMLAGSLAFASLTNIDIVLAAYFLPDDVAGVYAAAALVGKVVLFLPSSIVTVLLPKAAVRIAAGFSPHKILLASAAVTLVISLSAAVLLALTPESLLVWAFGPDFREATSLLGWFGLAMTAAALVNIYLSVYFAERDARFPLFVLAAAVAQVIGIAIWHSDPRSIVIVTLVCCTAVMVVHELAFPFALRRIIRS